MRPALLALVLLLTSPALAIDIGVTVTTDGADPNPGDGVCNDGTGACTLRAAIQTANATAGPDVVLLPEGLYRLSIKRGSEDDATGDLDVTSELTLTGAGNAAGCDGVGCTVIDAKKAKDRVFEVSAAGNLRLEGLSVRNGKAATDDSNDAPQIDEVSGGCIRVEGQLALDDVVVERCKSPDDGGCIGLNEGASAGLSDTFLMACKARDDGGGIGADGADLSAFRTTISACKAGDDGGGIETTGGTIFLRNVTLSGNKAREGGGLAVEEGTLASLVNATLADNKARDGANLHNEDDTAQLSLSNSIVHSKKGNDCDGFVNSLGYNLEGGSSCGFTATGDQQGEDPLIDALADNGGEVPSRALLAGSPAIDAGSGGMGCEPTDARGFGRSGTCDVGAFEFGGVAP